MALYGRYCHQCGQKNLEPKETVGHLVLHFFNDVTHFDGKFFSTVKYLLRKPSFLSAEYTVGRRARLKQSIVQFKDEPDKPQYMSLPELAKERDSLEDKLRGENDEGDREELRDEIGHLGIEMAFIK